MPRCATPRHSLGSRTGPCQQNAGLSGQTCNCSDVLQLSASAVCVDNKRIISCSGCKLGSEAGRVSPPQGACARVVPSPASQPWGRSTGLVLGHGVGHSCVGALRCVPYSGSGRLGCCSVPSGLNTAPGACLEPVGCWSRGHKDSLPFEVPTHVNGCQVSLRGEGRLCLPLLPAQGCHLTRLCQQEMSRSCCLWCLLARGQSKKGRAVDEQAGCNAGSASLGCDGACRDGCC